MTLMNKKDLILIRDGNPSDYGFIYPRWLRKLHKGNDWFNLVDKSIFFDKYQKIVDFILNDPNTKVKVACLVEDPSVILAFSVYSGNTLHWVYTKGVWRGIGLAKDLVPPNIDTVSHLTKMTMHLVKKKNLKFNPFFY